MHGNHTTLKASQIVAGGRSEASTPGSKNAPTQSILKGCQMASYRTDLRPQGHVTQEFTQRGFEGNQSKTTCADSILGVKSTFSGIPSGCFYQFDSVPGVSASLQPPATICDRFAIKITGQTSQFHQQISLPALNATMAKIVHNRNAFAPLRIL